MLFADDDDGADSHADDHIAVAFASLSEAQLWIRLAGANCSPCPSVNGPNAVIFDAESPARHSLLDKIVSGPLRQQRERELATMVAGKTRFQGGGANARLHPAGNPAPRKPAAAAAAAAAKPDAQYCIRFQENKCSKETNCRYAHYCSNMACFEAKQKHSRASCTVAPLAPTRPKSAAAAPNGS